MASLAGWPGTAEAARWYVKHGVEWVDSSANDGDSFHSRHKGRRYLWRLYYVDTPETEDNYPDRIREQAAYWNIPEDKVTMLGRKAARFSKDFCQDGFTVHTAHKNARGMSERKRRFAFVIVDGEYLSVALVRAGLARIHGLEDQHPEGPSEPTFRMRLKTAENEARKAKRGAWAHAMDPRSRFEKLNPSEPVDPQTVTVRRSIQVFSLRDRNRMIGYLQPGMEVKVLKSESPSMVRIRFQAGENKIYEAQCRRAALGL